MGSVDVTPWALLPNVTDQASANRSVSAAAEIQPLQKPLGATVRHPVLGRHRRVVHEDVRLRGLLEHYTHDYLRP